jgi:hypothetical protein
MSKNSFIPFHGRSHRGRLASFARHARAEWEDFRPAAILVAVYAGLVLIDGLLLTGLFGILDALGLLELPVGPDAAPASSPLPTLVLSPVAEEAA